MKEFDQGQEEIQALLDPEKRAGVTWIFTYAQHRFDSRFNRFVSQLIS